MDVSFLVKRWRLRAAEFDNYISDGSCDDDEVQEMESKKQIYLICANQLEHELRTLQETQCETCGGEGNPMGCGECGR